MKYAFIREHAEAYPVRVLCRVLEVSPSGYYGWQRRPVSRREERNRALLQRVVQIHRASYETYGYLRVHAELQAEGETCGKHRVARLMRRAGLKTRVQVLRERSRRGRTFEHVQENRLNREFRAPAPNQRWVSDITQIPTAEGWLYLAAVLDLYSRAVVGWSMSSRPGKELSTEALQMVIGRRGRTEGLMVHSDQGVHYRTGDYHGLLAQHGITCSMSRKGNCLDNAAMESFFHTLKTERVHHQRYRTRAEARRSVFEYIEGFYNRRRRHSYLQYVAPFEYEQQRAVS